MSPDIPNKPFDPNHPDLDQARSMLQIAIDEARLGLQEGGVPVGAALFDNRGTPARPRT